MGKMNNSGKLLLLLFLFVLFGSCGLEDYPYINAVPQSNITQELNNRAIVRLPNDYTGTPFTHFAVFYRIYVSSIPQASTTISSYSAINPVLASDYNSFSTYIDSTTLVNVNMDSLFSGRGYKYLNLMDHNISNVLSSSVLGGNLVFDFSSSKVPTMTAASNVYTLWRSDGNGLFSPRPDRLFINREELWKSENINTTINADVANKSGLEPSERRYTYAAMFIIAVGIDISNYSNIYSTPSLIHVFQLPD
jgi:hypothetical protein